MDESSESGKAGRDGGAMGRRKPAGEVSDEGERIEEIAAGRFLRFVKRGRWEYVSRVNATGVVGVVAVTGEGKLLLVEQYRPPVGRNVVELPAGLAGDGAARESRTGEQGAAREGGAVEQERGERGDGGEGEQGGGWVEGLAGAAGRELEEETGYRAGGMELLAAGPASAGVTDEVLHLFMARDLERVGPGGGDAGESIIVHEVPVAEVEEFIRNQRAQGKGIDLKIYAGLYFLKREG